jgi:hypothetical protein
MKESTFKIFITTDQEGRVNKKNRILSKGMKTKTICHFLLFTSDKKIPEQRVTEFKKTDFHT